MLQKDVQQNYLCWKNINAIKIYIFGNYKGFFGFLIIKNFFFFLYFDYW